MRQLTSADMRRVSGGENSVNAYRVPTNTWAPKQPSWFRWPAPTFKS